MEFAHDIKGNRIDAWDYAPSDKDELVCPVCKKPVVFRNGDINIPHFAHKSGECTDHWHYDMSEWHKIMQSLFPSENREVVIKYKDCIHRADVLIKNTVIEFQHSQISTSEFNDRNRFFANLGYRVAWVFDVSEEWDSERIDLLQNKQGSDLYKWLWAPHIFNEAPPITDHNKSFSLWLDFGEDDFGSASIEKVVWTIKDESGQQSLKRFACSQSIPREDIIDVDLLFKSNKDYVFEEIKSLKSRTEFFKKCIGEKGHKRDDYICPRRNSFGLRLGGEEGCCYCRYCGLIVCKERKDNKVFTIYCCYPNQIRELMEIHPSYECVELEKYYI